MPGNNSHTMPTNGIRKMPSNADAAFMLRSAMKDMRKLNVVNQRTKKNSTTSPKPMAHQENSRCSRNSAGQTTSAKMGVMCAAVIAPNELRRSRRSRMLTATMMFEFHQSINPAVAGRGRLDSGLVCSRSLGSPPANLCLQQSLFHDSQPFRMPAAMVSPSVNVLVPCVFPPPGGSGAKASGAIIPDCSS